MSFCLPGSLDKPRMGAKISRSQIGNVGTGIPFLSVVKKECDLWKKHIFHGKCPNRIHEDGAKSPSAENRIANRDMHRHLGMIILHLHQTSISKSIIDGHMHNFKLAVGLRFGGNHNCNPWCGFRISVSPPLDEGIFNPTLHVPQFDLIAGIVGHNALTVGASCHFGVQTIAVVVFCLCFFDQNGT